MPKSKVGFYAVAKGRETGVFLSWEECEAQIKNFAGARYKKLHSATEAEAYVAQFVPGTAAASHRPAVAASPATFPVPSSLIATSATQATLSNALQGNSKRNRAAEVLADESGWEIVYSDGACKGNGKPGSVAGIGVWWGRDDPRNLAERCPGAQTNNRAELIAIVRVLETVPHTAQRLLIKTDSQYSINCFQSWMPKWLAKGFVGSNGDPIKNEAIIRYLSALLDQRGLEGQKVHLQYVRGHSGEEGNEGADYLANVGTTMPELPERNWNALRAGIIKAKVPAQPTPVQATATAKTIKTVSQSRVTPAVAAVTSLSERELQEYADCLLDDDELDDELMWDDT